jgi:hypothetical protein
MSVADWPVIVKDSFVRRRSDPHHDKAEVAARCLAQHEEIGAGDAFPDEIGLCRIGAAEEYGAGGAESVAGRLAELLAQVPSLSSAGIGG